MAQVHNGATTLCPKLSIEALLSVNPHKPTDPRVPHKIMVEDTSCGIFQRRFQMILYYKKTTSVPDKSGWLVAGRMKETLGVVLSDHPHFAGRLRRVGGERDGELEIVPNDSGARLLKADISLSFDEFISLDDKNEVEAQLVHWEDIDVENPQFSPLFYIQVTNFSCGQGYSVGISCSLLLSDPLAMTSLLTTWTIYHNEVSSKLGNLDRPLFYLPHLKETKATPHSSNGQTATLSPTSSCKNLVFKFASKDIINLDSETQKAIAMQCIDESGHKLSTTNFFLLMKVKSSEDVVVKVDDCVKKILDEPISKIVNGQGFSSGTNWDFLGVDGINFDGGNGPVLVACSINSLVNEGMGVVIASPDKDKFGIIVIVIVPNDE